MSGLAAVGLDPSEVRVYEALLDRRTSTAAELASAVGLAKDKVRRTLDTLETKGLVSRPPGRTAYTAARPDLAIEALILRRRDELERAREEAEKLAARFSRSRPGPGQREPVELVRGPDAVAQWWVQVQRSAQREVLMMDRPPYVMPLRGPNPVEMELLGAGITYRVLYDESSLDTTGKWDSVTACVAAGEQARVRAGVPIKLLIADGSLALTYDPEDVQRSAIVVRASSVLTALVAVFESLWREAAPLGVRGPGGLDEMDLRILTMLGAGSKDERIARQLGVSVRTVRRRIHAILDTLGVSTRFQAALVASRRGLL